MATASTLRLRRSAAERHALAGVERDIRVHDPNGRQKYLRDYHQAYLSYQAVMTRRELERQMGGADVILIADYHALPASQRFAAEVVETLSRESGRPVVLGVEFVLARDQHVLDRWLREEVSNEELRARLRFDAQGPDSLARRGGTDLDRVVEHLRDRRPWLRDVPSHASVGEQAVRELPDRRGQHGDDLRQCGAGRLSGVGELHEPSHDGSSAGGISE